MRIPFEISKPRKSLSVRAKVVASFLALYIFVLASYFFFVQWHLVTLFAVFFLTFLLILFFEKKIAKTASILTSEKVEIEKNDHLLNLQTTAAELEKKEIERKLKEQELRIADYIQMVKEQRDLLAKRDDRIISLESRIDDLIQEIRTILGFDEKSKVALNFSLPILEEKKTFISEEISFFDLSRRLDKCIKIAEEFAPHPVNSPFLTLAEERCSLDIPKFGMRLEEDLDHLLLIYSSDERKILYAHPSVRSILGWNPEKFTRLFFHLMAKGLMEWKESLTLASQGQECPPLHISLRDTDGEERKFQGLFGLIRRGSLSGLMIGIFSEV